MEHTLKEYIWGIMFVITIMDGNEQIYPLTFGFGDKENDRSWTWFLTEVRNVTRSCPDLMVISKRHISINNVVRECFL